MGLIEGHPRTPGLNARARRGSARLSTTDPDLVQLQGTFIVNVYTDLAGVGTHGEIALYKPAGNPYLVLLYSGTWYTSAGGAIS